MNPWCDTVLGLVIMSCETSSGTRGDSDWSFLTLALIPLVLACYFFMRFLSNDQG
jgi:hypothetical protein